jgi:hypothetical protein
VEDEQIVVVDPWKSYASLALSYSMTANDLSGFSAGSGKSILWYVVV